MSISPWSAKPAHSQGHIPPISSPTSPARQSRWLWFPGHSTYVLSFLSTWPKCVSKSQTQQHFPLAFQLQQGLPCAKSYPHLPPHCFSLPGQGSQASVSIYGVCVTFWQDLCTCRPRQDSLDSLRAWASIIPPHPVMSRQLCVCLSVHYYFVESERRQVSVE